MGNNNKRVVAVVSDLMFTVKIQEGAKRAGLEAVFVKSKQEALEQAKMEPAVIILDLNNTATDALEVIEELKGGEETRKIRLLGFVSHVQADLKHAAQQKGCDTVIARSAFSQNLPTILGRYAEREGKPGG
jgi:CheY-like chemotaxis protein